MFTLKSSDGGFSVSIEIAVCGDANLRLHVLRSFLLERVAGLLFDHCGVTGV